MKRRLINTMQAIWPNKMLRKQQFAKRIKNRHRHNRKYNMFTYRHNPKASRFNRWQDYRRIIDRTY